MSSEHNATTSPDVTREVLTLEWARHVDSTLEHHARRLQFVERVERAMTDFELRLDHRFKSFEARVAQQFKDAREVEEDRQSNVNVNVNIPPHSTRGSMWHSLKPMAQKHKTPIVASIAALITFVAQALIQYLATR